jgi:hypothetical protein
VREAVAVGFVLIWLALLLADVVTESYRVPFWLDTIGIGVLAYALGLNAADLAAYRESLRGNRRDR